MSKLAEIRTKFFKANYNETSSNTSSSDTPVAKRPEDPFANKFNATSNKCNVSTNNFNACCNKPPRNITQQQQQKTSSSSYENNTSRNSLRIEIVNNSPKTSERKPIFVPVQTVKKASSENTGQKTDSHVTLKRQGAFNRKVSPYIVACSVDEKNRVKESNAQNTYVKSQAVSGEKSKLSEIELKFLNLRRNIEMANDGKRVFI